MGSWTGSGPIMTGTCSTAAWTLFDLSTAYLWAPVIGCMPDKLDCCPSSFVFATATSSTTTPSSIGSASTTITSPTDSDILNIGPTGTNAALPSTALTAIRDDCERSGLDPSICSNIGNVVTPLKINARAGAIATAGPGVARCPEDYVSAGSTGCCPFGMTPTSSPSNLPLPACASQLSVPFPAPELTSLGLEPSKPISTATDIIYALQYRITTLEYQPPPNSPQEGLSTGAKAGIGAGGGFLALVLIGAVVYFLRRRRHSRTKQGKAGTRNGGEGGEETKEKNEPIVGGRAELGADDVKARYELASSHGRAEVSSQQVRGQGQDDQRVYYTGSPPPVPGTPIYELSNTPRVAYGVPVVQGQGTGMGMGQQYGYQVQNPAGWVDYTAGSGVPGNR